MTSTPTPQAGIASSANKSSSSTKRFVLDFMSGGLAGAISKTVAAPLERIKLLMQTQHENTRLKLKYKGVVDCFVRSVTEEGVLSLWRGNTINVIRYFPTQALNFSFKESFTKVFNPYDPKTHPNKFFWGSILSGGMAGCATTLFVYPLDFARTRIGVDIGRKKEERQFKGIADCVRQVHKSDGIKGLYKGFGVSLFGIFIYRGLYFGIYDAGKALLLPENKKDNLIWKFFFAQFVVITSETISYPTDTVKRKMMMQSASGEKLYSNTIDCCKKIYKQNGIGSFYTGNSSNILRSVGSSICLVLYDEFRKISHKY